MHLRLEGIIEERTVEIREQNVQLEQQNEEILAQQEELQSAYDNLEDLNKVVNKKNEQIMDSIDYARFIQQAILPDLSMRSELLNNHLVYFRPKDQVSGDFYWMHSVDEDHVIWAAADCTGHGVPGAMMSMICNAALNKLVIDHKTTNPSYILNHSRQEIIRTLNSRGGDARKDGMNIALCLLNRKTLQLRFAAAYNPLYIIRNDEISEYAGDMQPVSMYIGEQKPFNEVRIQLQKGDRLYTFTDGYMDQLGGKKTRRLGKKIFQKILLDHQDKDFTTLESNLDKAFTKWKGTYPQIDDVTIFAVEI